MKIRFLPKMIFIPGAVMIPLLLLGLTVLITQKNYREASTRMTMQSDRCVVLIHGLLRTPDAMSGLEKYFLARGYSVINFSHDSVGAGIEKTGERLDTVLISGEGARCRSYYFAGHSMGVIVGRHYLARRELKGMSRFVMIAPPNRGSRWGNLVEAWLPGAAKIIGPAMEFINTPVTGGATSYEFGVIAGGTGTRFGLNPFIPGDDDMTVGVEETKIPGMNDFYQVRGQHTLLLRSDEVARLTLNFFERGKFAP